MRAFFANSALAFATAMLATAAIHETGHALAAQGLGFAPSIYAFYENNPSGAPWQNLIILSAGPIASLIVGSLCFLWLRRAAARYSYWLLLLFWFAWLGILEFVNYLVVTPWLTAGDTAQIADVLHWPLGARYALAAAGIAIVLLLLRPAARSMFALAPQDVALDTGFARRRYIMRGFYLPLILGVALTALGGIGTNPLAVGLGLLATFGNIDLIAMSLFVAQTVPVPHRGTSAVLRIEPAAIALWIAIVLFYIFALPGGLRV